MTNGLTYSGAPARVRAKRPSIPRTKRKEMKEANGNNKENMNFEAGTLRQKFNEEISKLAMDYGFSRSTVAAIAYGSKKPVFPRGPNARNAFTAVKMAEVNKARGPGNSLTLTEFNAQYGHEYANLPVAKKLEYIEKLKRQREEKAVKQDSTVRKVGVHAAADIRTTTYNLINSTANLPERAGYAIMAIGARTDYGSPAQPFDAIPECLEGFCESVFGIPPALVAQKAETYILKGGLAAVELTNKKRVNLRGEVTKFLRTSFLEASGSPGARMNYTQWLTKMSMEYRVVLEGWPPGTIYKPNDFKLPLLRRLKSEIDAKKIFYRAMTDEEYAQAQDLVAQGFPLDRSPPSETSFSGDGTAAVASGNIAPISDAAINTNASTPTTATA